MKGKHKTIETCKRPQKNFQRIERRIKMNEIRIQKAPKTLLQNNKLVCSVGSNDAIVESLPVLIKSRMYETNIL